MITDIFSKYAGGVQVLIPLVSLNSKFTISLFILGQYNDYKTILCNFYTEIMHFFLCLMNIHVSSGIHTLYPFFLFDC